MKNENKTKPDITESRYKFTTTFIAIRLCVSEYTEVKFEDLTSIMHQILFPAINTSVGLTVGS